MEEIGFCKECRKQVLKKYNFCPWCGSGLKEIPDWEKALDSSFEKIGKYLNSLNTDRDLLRLEKELQNLEKEINQILSQEKDKFIG